LQALQPPGIQGFLTLEQYEFLRGQIYGTREMGLQMREVPEMREYVQRLKLEGHNLAIISSRGNKKSDPGKIEIAREWMELHNLSIPFVGVGEGVSKVDACRGLDAYIDDDLDKLEPLVGRVSNLFLFSWDYNLHIPAEKIAKRVNSWKHFYGEISKLKQKD